MRKYEVTVHDCVVRITESNKLYSSGSIHKKPNEYAPGDVLGTITLSENDLIFFDYTVGQEEFYHHNKWRNN